MNHQIPKGMIFDFNGVLWWDSLFDPEAAYRTGIGSIVALGASDRHAQLMGLEGVDRKVCDLSKMGSDRFMR